MSYTTNLFGKLAEKTSLAGLGVIFAAAQTPDIRNPIFWSSIFSGIMLIWAPETKGTP